MLTPRDAAIRLLKLMMVASLVLPAVLFVFAGWINYRNFQHVTDERINRSLDILHEHALKVLQTVQVAFDEIDAIINGMPDDEIQRNEGRLHDRLARIVATLPQLQGIVIIDREGRPLVASNVLPAPTNVNLANRDYFTAQVSKDAGTYVSGIHAPRMGGLDTSFFAMSQRRRSPDGKFNGVISIALVPGYFEDFYSKMSAYEGNYFALARQDGT